MWETVIEMLVTNDLETHWKLNNFRAARKHGELNLQLKISFKWALNNQFLCSYITFTLWYIVSWQAHLSNLISIGPQNVSKGLWFIKRKDTSNSEQSATARNTSQKYSSPSKYATDHVHTARVKTMPFIWRRKIEHFNSVNTEVTEQFQELDSGMYAHLYKSHDRLWSF